MGAGMNGKGCSRAVEGAAVVGRERVRAVGQHGRGSALRVLSHGAPDAVLEARIDGARGREVRHAVGVAADVVGTCRDRVTKETAETVVTDYAWYQFNVQLVSISGFSRRWRHLQQSARNSWEGVTHCGRSCSSCTRWSRALGAGRTWSVPDR
jgi:hypothetical protein